MNRPDGWVLLKVDYNDEVIYKIFASWAGGYTYGDSWKVNSGIKSVEEDGDYLLIHGFSGSTYKVHKEGYNRLTWYNASVLENMLAKIEEIEVYQYPDIPSFKELGLMK